MNPTVTAATSPRNVFTYGSLMFAPVWSSVVRGHYRPAPACIHGFRRVCVSGHEHPALIIAPGAAALQGVMYFDVDAADLARLDHFETVNYARVSVAATIAGTAHIADAYLALHMDELSDEDWDPAAFEREGLRRFLATYALAHAPRD